MSVHVLLNLLNKLRGKDDMLGSDEHFIIHFLSKSFYHMIPYVSL